MQLLRCSRRHVEAQPGPRVERVQRLGWQPQVQASAGHHLDRARQRDDEFRSVEFPVNEMPGAKFLDELNRKLNGIRRAGRDKLDLLRPDAEPQPPSRHTAEPRDGKKGAGTKAYQAGALPTPP